MSNDDDALFGRTLDELLFHIDDVMSVSALTDWAEAYENGDFASILSKSESGEFCHDLLRSLTNGSDTVGGSKKYNRAYGHVEICQAFMIGLAAFNAFLQANVTGPPLSTRSSLFEESLDAQEVTRRRASCTKSLALEGLSVYQHIPHVELFCLARMIFTVYFPRISNGAIHDCRWMRVRINVFHQRLLSSGTSNALLSESAAGLQREIEEDLAALQKDVLAPGSSFSTEVRVKFLLEKAQIYIMQGIDFQARENLAAATDVSGFTYALSGALGKRTRFQEKDISQLVVFAKSKPSPDQPVSEPDLSGKVENVHITSTPAALELNDDTLLEEIAYTKQTNVADRHLPQELQNLQPDEQPQLVPLDQTILLAEATLKDTLAPLDKLNSEEILPYAVRVLSDKSTNWQIYTQALLVRSRIEAHRSRTQERSVLQLQAIVDQIVADTQEDVTGENENGIPQIQITQFLPRAKESESAPVMERLRYVYALNSPTRWEIETELAYAWSKAGSFISALEIFKRLKLWPEVALCYHTVGQEDKAKQVVRRQLYFSSEGPAVDQYEIDADEVVSEQWQGDMREPPPHAPRLWCILGDLEQDATCWERAWKISGNRYARAQRTLGEYHTRKGDLVAAREAYIKASVVNRQNHETWSRLGDIDLKVGNWDGAIIAFQQSIMIDNDDSKTYSNLGSALLSKYQEMMEVEKLDIGSVHDKNDSANIDGDDDVLPTNHPKTSPKDVLRQSLVAYKKGASLAHDNWKIWDNVITIAGRSDPPAFPDIIMGMRNVIRIRKLTDGEEAIDIDILRALVGEVMGSERVQNASQDHSSTIYLPPRGSVARAVIEMVNNDIVPLITNRAELWFIVEKLALYQRDYAMALSSAEKAWRIATSGDAWLEEAEQWKNAAEATEALVSAFENYGPQEKASGAEEVEKGWKMKARTAVRGVLGKAKEAWDETDEYQNLKERLNELKG